MKKLSFAMLMALCIFAVSCTEENGTSMPKRYTLSLPDYTKADTIDLGNDENFVDSLTDAYGTSLARHILTDVSGHFEFDCIKAPWGMSSNSFAFSNAKNLPTYDYSAVSGTGKFKATYVVVGAPEKVAGDTNTFPAVRFKSGKNAKGNKAYNVEGLYVSNCKYTYGSITEGTGFYGEQEIYSDQDTLRLIVSNLERTAEVKFDLAAGKNISKDWQWIELSQLGATEGLIFNLYTTKRNEWGAITPTYFCLDGIAITEIAE